MPTPPDVDDHVTTPDGTRSRVLAVIPLTSGNGYRVPVLRDSDETETPPNSRVSTLVYVADQVVELSHPYDWTSTASGPSAPLACEVKTGDVLPPARAATGRPSLHDDEGPILSPQVVLTVSWDQYDRVVVITTRDAMQQVRTYRRGLEEVMDPSRPYVSTKRRTRPKGPAKHPEVFHGPIINERGAQFILQERNRRGGRPRQNEPKYDPEKPPLFDEETGDLMPYIVMMPGRSVHSGDGLEGASWRSPHTFSPTARRLPEVKQILEREGVETP